VIKKKVKKGKAISNRVWFKHRANWGSGPGMWEYDVQWVNADTSDEQEEEVRLFFEEYAEKNFGYSELFRGMEWHVIDLPPLDYLSRLLESNKNKIRSLRIEKSHLTLDLARALEKEDET